MPWFPVGMECSGSALSFLLEGWAIRLTHRDGVPVRGKDGVPCLKEAGIKRKGRGAGCGGDAGGSTLGGPTEVRGFLGVWSAWEGIGK